MDLILYKLENLQSAVTDGFKRLDAGATDLNKRLSVLEIWQARVDSDIKNLAVAFEDKQASPNAGLIKIALGVIAALGTLATAILYLIGGKK